MRSSFFREVDKTSALIAFVLLRVMVCCYREIFRCFDLHNDGYIDMHDMQGFADRYPFAGIERDLETWRAYFQDGKRISDDEFHVVCAQSISSSRRWEGRRRRRNRERRKTRYDNLFVFIARSRDPRSLLVC